jgi:hypothetical protein
MNITRIFFSTAIALLATSVRAQEPGPPQSLSPDGKWEFRLAAPDQRIFVIAKRGSKETSVALSEDGGGTFAQYAKVIWAPDSKRFAFNYRPGFRDQEMQIFQLEGDEWRELASPGSSDAITAPIERSMEAQRKKLKLSPKKTGRPISDGCQARRWIDPGTLLVYARSAETFEIKGEMEEVGDACFVTIKFSAQGEWEPTRTRLLSKKDAGLNKEEREELALVQKELAEE